MDKPVSHIWTMRGLYVLLTILVLFVHLLPLNSPPDRWPFPEVLVALTFAWILRRPDYVPTILIALTMLMADLLLQRPPGLLAALVVIGSAYLRSAATGMKDMGFIGEWTTVAVVITAVFLANRIVLSILSVDQAALGPVVIQLVFTVLAYPIVVFVSKNAFGVRRIASGDAKTTGARA